MGGKSQDFGDVAASQGEENRQVVQDQLYANRPTQYTPFGYTNWESTPYTDAQGNTTERWTQTQGLTPELQDILNKQIAIQGGRTDVAGMLTGRMGAEFGKQMDWRGLNPMGQTPTAQFTLPEELQRSVSNVGLQGATNPTDVQKNINMEGLAGIDDPYQTRQRAEDAMYSQAQSRIQPAQQSEREQLEIKMRNQGLGPEDAAWQSQMQNMNQKHTDQTNQAIWSATQAGREESGQMFGQQLGRRQQGFGERDTMFNAYNQGAGQAFGQTTGLRGQQFGERQAQGNFANQAAMNEYNQSLGANQQNWNQALQGSQYSNQIRQQQLTEAMQKRGFSLNEINALLSGQQVGMPQMPNFQPASSATPAPIMQGAAQQASMEQAASPWNAIAGLGGQALGGYIGAGGKFGL